MGKVQSDTPMMQQFNALKGEYPDCILFFRAGDFYEMFGEDAIRASEVLGITLTTRNKSSENPVPMAGVPYHSYEGYLNRLTSAGFKVAIAEQMEDPAQAKAQGRDVVQRDVVRVITPGTSVADPILEGDRHHFLAAVAPAGMASGSRQPLGAALVDLSTGVFEVVEFPPGALDQLVEFLVLERPAEILLAEGRTPEETSGLEDLERRLARRMDSSGRDVVRLERVPALWFDPKPSRRRLAEQFDTLNLAGFGVEQMESALRAGGAILTYLERTQKCELIHLAPPRPRMSRQVMWLDEATVEHLELFASRGPGGRGNTLFAVLNRTCTPMGARLLRRWLGQPLLELEEIEARQEAVAELAAHSTERTALRETLRRIRDLERCVGRMSLPGAGLAEMVALREALGGVQFLPPQLEHWKSTLLVRVGENMDPLDDIYGYLKERFKDDPPLKLAEGGYVADGVLPELDELRALTRDSRLVINDLEASERAATGITSLKVRFNRVFGYYLEVPRTHQNKVPAHYHRKQTLVNAERFITPELKVIEEKILGAEERISALEQEAFRESRTILHGYARRMQGTAERLAVLDTLAGLAETALASGYIRPKILPPDAPRVISLKEARHPVIEQIDLGEPFIPNDIHLDGEQAQIMLITGPNMAGKSTVMRQVALIQLMAQAGSHVPAGAALLPLVDRIFTRVGASDNLSRGQSTFMLEMNEAANILNNATRDSLIVLDEIGRGTSTFDGISIAWAMVEHLHRLGALTLFATHYHELTQLARELPRLRNHSMSIREDGEHLAFTRKLIAGEADRSYGIQVARLAGLPVKVVERAQEVMNILTAAGNGSGGGLSPDFLAGIQARKTAPGGEQSGGEESGGYSSGEPSSGGEDRPQTGAEQAALGRKQLSFLAETHPMLEEIRGLDINKLTPMEALNYLHQAQAKLDKGET
ncbi:MAG: DNA mismatch repair protein MutS [Deltaproteobacteria bacterium]|nr:DNA mismatch repair protein MutS [Deltaproteobacteria bacterium]